MAAYDSGIVEVQRPAPVEEQPLAPVYAEGYPAGKQLRRKSPVGPRTIEW